MAERLRNRSPAFICQLCGQAIESLVDATIADAGMAHVLCVDTQQAPPLTPDERSHLIRICWDHEIAVCSVCDRKYRMDQMLADLFRRRYDLCPFCRVDLVPSIRRHIAECAIIRTQDPQWQAEVRETLARATATRKQSGQLRDASELARVESEVLLKKVREAAVAARQAQQESERVKREPPDGK